MKLWSSLIKEFKLASRSFYFYVEIGMAVLMLTVLLLVIPNEYNPMVDEYLYINMSEAEEENFLEILLEEYYGLAPEIINLEIGNVDVPVRRFSTDENYYHVFDQREDLLKLVEIENEAGAEVYVGDSGELRYTYFLQGYESERMRNILLVLHNEDIQVTGAIFDAQEVRTIEEKPVLLSFRENALPSFLTFNGALMGFFIVAAYVFLDKKEDVIRAYAVTSGAIWQYLMSKIMIVAATSVVTSLIIVVPVMGAQAQYIGLLIFLLATGFFTSSLGLLVSGFYENINKSFGALSVVMMVFMIPGVAYYIPSWEPAWIRLIPTYYVLEGFKEMLLPAGELSYVLMSSLGFFLAGMVLFLLADLRFRNTLLA